MTDFNYSYGREPWIPREEFPKEKLPPGKTPLAEALMVNDMPFAMRDLTMRDHALARLRKEVLTELRPQFEAEKAMFIWEDRMGDADGVIQAVAEGLHARYLYHIRLAGPHG